MAILNIQKKFQKKSKKFSSKRASEGMTAAILLIAFIITASGVAFVILSMGSEIQLELGNVGDKGQDIASSAIQIEGGIISGFAQTEGSALKVVAYAMNFKLILSSGKVDLTDSAIEVSISVNYAEEIYLSIDYTIDALGSGGTTNAKDADQLYGIGWFNSDNHAGSPGTNVQSGDQSLQPNEMARFYFGLGGGTDGAAAGENVVISISSSVALFKHEFRIPVTLAADINIM